MSSIAKIIIVVVAAVFSLIAGFFAGYFTATMTPAFNISQELAAQLSAGRITVSVSGFVIFVDGREVSVNSNGQVLTIPIAESAEIMQLFERTLDRKMVGIDAIKGGQTVTIYTTIGSDGTLVGDLVSIQPLRASGN